MSASIAALGARTAIASTVICTAVLAAQPQARADLINYVFQPGTKITVQEANSPFNSYTETITGSFTFNTSGDVLSAVDVTMSGSPSYFDSSPTTFLYYFNLAGFTSANSIGLAFAGNNDDSSYLAELQFAPFGGNDLPLFGGALYNGQDRNNAFANSVSGGVEFAAAGVPGPVAGAGIPGLVLAGGILIVWWRRTRRAVTRAGSFPNLL